MGAPAEVDFELSVAWPNHGSLVLVTELDSRLAVVERRLWTTAVEQHGPGPVDQTA